MKTTHKVEVLGNDITKPPLLERDDVKFIVVRDSLGKPMILVVHIGGDTWGVSASTDDDWKVVLERFGINE